MIETDNEPIAGFRRRDPETTRLPNRVVAVVVALALLPLLLNGLGISFSMIPISETKEETAETPVQERIVLAQERNQGEIVFILLEWTAFNIALATVVVAMTHYFVAHDVTTPTISTALFFSGMIDAFQSLAAVHLLPFAIAVEDFLPFTWFVSRLVNAGFLIAGTLPFVWSRHGHAIRPREKELRYLILAAVLFAVMAYGIVFLCATATKLPTVVHPNARFIHRPWDVLPLLLYLFAGGVVFPRFYRAQPSVFSHALLVSVIPNVAAQLYAAFGSVALYDNSFNIASYHKIVAYLVPFMGLLIDYRRAYDADVALHVTEEKLRVARSVQQGLLPQGPPEVQGYDIDGFYHPADQVGGDYYDYIRMADGRWGIVVADVSGHEIGASLLMAKTRAYLRALAKSSDKLETMLGRLHDFLVEDTRDRWFVTMFFASLDPQTGVLEYAGAAQQAHLLRADGSLVVLKSTSTPLGVFADHPPRCAPVVVINPGDIFIAVTDGVVEAKSPGGEQFGQDRMISVVREHQRNSATQIIEALVRSVRAFCGSDRAADDITIVIACRAAVA